MDRWLERYEGEGLEGLDDRSHRPAHGPHQMPAAVEVMVLEMRRAHAYWGARRIAYELARKQVEPAPSESEELVWSSAARPSPWHLGCSCFHSDLWGGAPRRHPSSKMGVAGALLLLAATPL